jgi:hypothetical protein
MRGTGVTDQEYPIFAAVTVVMPSALPFGEVAPFLDALKGPFPSVTTHHYVGAGGGPDVVVPLVVLLIESPYVQGFLQKAGELHYAALHEQLARWMGRGNERIAGESGQSPEEAAASGRVPLTLQVEQLHLHFHGEPDAEGVRRRLLKAAEVVPQLPEEYLQAPDLEGAHTVLPLNLFFDETLQR